MERELLAMAQEVNRDLLSTFSPEDQAALVASLQALRMRMPAEAKLEPDEDEIDARVPANASSKTGRGKRPAPASGARRVNTAA